MGMSSLIQIKRSIITVQSVDKMKLKKSIIKDEIDRYNVERLFRSGKRNLENYLCDPLNIFFFNRIFD
jgi:hypothetical protein